MADPTPTGTIGQSPAFALPREGITASETGFQAAHMFGNDFVNNEGSWLKRLFPETGAADRSWPWNFVQLGETKGTAAANGTSVHAGRDVAAFDALLYNNGDGPLQVLNSYQEEFETAKGDPAKVLEIQQKVIALAYYLKYLQLDQRLLPEGEATLAFNGSDYRIVSYGGQTYNLDIGADVTSYLKALLPITLCKRPQARLTILYCSTDRLRRGGAPMKNLAHSASFQSLEKIAPSKLGIKHLAGHFDAEFAGFAGGLAVAVSRLDPPTVWLDHS